MEAGGITGWPSGVVREGLGFGNPAGGEAGVASSTGGGAGLVSLASGGELMRHSFLTVQEMKIFAPAERRNRNGFLLSLRQTGFPEFDCFG
jgi:hypothetical protein